MTRLSRGCVCGLPPICFRTRGCARAASLIHGRLSRGSALWPPHDLFQYKRACHRSLPKSCAGASRSHCASYLGLPFVGSSPSVSMREGAPGDHSGPNFDRCQQHLRGNLPLHLGGAWAEPRRTAQRRSRKSCPKKLSKKSSKPPAGQMCRAHVPLAVVVDLRRSNG